MKFEHIYVENEVVGKPETNAILKAFPRAEIVYIDHYKDVFNRTRQNVRLQHDNQNLIIADKKGSLIYKGAPVCQDFGEENFYYTSCVMNCVYDCEYCYLKGMYPSGNMVVFVNLEDTFAELENLLRKQSVYLCVSYDTDLLALENVLHYVERWVEFARAHEALTIEIRTKCARTDIFEKSEPCERVIMAYTVSPDEVISKYEHGTGSLAGRLGAAAAAVSAGWPVRLCFDPVIYVKDWENCYGAMFEKVKSSVDLAAIRDFSVGSFRISESYLKLLRRNEPDSAVVQYPFELDGGYYHYPMKLAGRMENYLRSMILEACPGASVFSWEE